MTTDERDKRISRMTDYQKYMVISSIHDVLFRRFDENGRPVLDPDKPWHPPEDLLGLIAGAFGGTLIGYVELGGKSDLSQPLAKIPPVSITGVSSNPIHPGGPVPLDLHATKRLCNEAAGLSADTVTEQIAIRLSQATARLIRLVEGLREMMYLDVDDDTGLPRWNPDMAVNGGDLVDWCNEELVRLGLKPEAGPV